MGVQKKEKELMSLRSVRCSPANETADHHIQCREADGDRAALPSAHLKSEGL